MRFITATRVLAATTATVASLGGAAALPDLAPAASAAPAGAYGYVWANQPTAASYLPSPSYSRNSTGSANSIERNGTGNYTVAFPGLGSAGGGTVDVTAYDSSGFCKVASWFPSGSTLYADVVCFNAGGLPADSYFDASFSAASSPPAHLTYLWADRPSAASYVPSGTYQYNSGGGTDSIVRNSKGNYTVTIPGIGLDAGTVKVSGYGVQGRPCRSGGWGGTPTLQVNVLCTLNGAPADAYFTMTWVSGGSLLGHRGGKWGYVWANGPTVASYTPAVAYQGNSSGALNTATRLGTGNYLIHFPNLGGDNGDVQVSAYSTDAVCNSAGWGGDGAGGADVYVSCYDSTGTPVDAYFDAQYGV